METFRKVVRNKESQITQILAQHKVAPKLLLLRPTLDNKFIIKIEKYPTTLLDYFDNDGDIKQYIPEIKRQIEKMHSLGIIHGDLHGNNIVINPDTNDVRLIDFGKSYYIHEIDDDVIDELNVFLKPYPFFRHIDDILRFEFEMYKRDIGKYQLS